MKTLNASFTDLNGKVINIETDETLSSQLDLAVWCLEINNNDTPTLPVAFKQQIKEYWQHRLDCLKLIKELIEKENTATPQIESITIFLVMDLLSRKPVNSYLDENLARKIANESNVYYVLPVMLNTDSDIYTIQDLQGHINKDVNP